EEKKILDGITFKEKSEYRYKVDDKYVYYVKEDLEKKRIFVLDEKNIKDIGKVKKVSEELPVGAMEKELSEEWKAAFQIIQPHYVYPDQTIKIVDQKMYDGITSKEGIVCIGKTDDFVAYTKEWKKLDELQLAKYKNVRTLNSKNENYMGFNSIFTGIIFMGFFLGIAFLAMMASCLMFKVLSGASNDITRYQMLRKIGVRQELLTKSIYKELFFVFLFPAILGIAHVLVGMNIFS
ncbi:ABC transporter permease, partial [Bacillus wiedmannii]